MIESGTPQGTGATVADAAERIASLLGPADSEPDETQGETPDTDDAEADAPEGDEAEAEDGESDEPENPDEADEQPALYTVKVAGDEVQVTLDEALKGYSREQDYVRKTMALADQKKSAEAEVAAARNEYRSGLETVQKIIESRQPRVDQSLRDTSPGEWSAQMQQHRMWAEQRGAVAAETDRLKGEATAEEARERQAFVAAEREKLLVVIPEWADASVADAESRKLREYGLTVGFTDDDLNDVADHRAVSVLRDAMRYRELVSKSQGVKAKVEAVKSAKPGSTAAAPSKTLDLQRAKQRLKQSGSVDDAEAAILRMMR